MTLEQAISQAEKITTDKPQQPIWIVKNKKSQIYHTFANPDTNDELLHSCYLNGICITDEMSLDKAQQE